MNDDPRNAGSGPRGGLFDEYDMQRMANGFRDAANTMYGMMGRSPMGAEELGAAWQNIASDRDGARVMELMSRAYFTWMSQGMRYWGSMADRQSSYMSTLMARVQSMRDDPNVSDSERRALVDEAEQYLREISDLTMREGRLFQQEIEKLAAELRSSYAEQLPDGERRRYGGVKP